MEATAIILAGGKNSRMGKNKAFLQVGQEKIIDNLTRKLNPLFQQVIIVTNEPEKYAYLDMELVSDIIPGLGPLSGMHAGLVAAKYDYSLIMACDMPFIEGKLSRMMVKEARGFDVTVPQVGEYLQPLFAVYHKNCIKYIEECLNQSIFKIISFYPKVKVKYVSQEKIAQAADLDRVFVNVNTPRQFMEACSMAKDKKMKTNMDKQLKVGGSLNA